MENVTQLDITRQDRLFIWLKRNKVNILFLAEKMELSRGAVSRLLRSETIPTRRHSQFSKLGIPEDLLPDPLDINPGRKRKNALPQ